MFSTYSFEIEDDIIECYPAIYCELLSKPNKWNKYWNSDHPVYWGINENNYIEILSHADGVLVPGGFGDRGIEGKILAVKWDCRTLIIML